MDLTAAFVPFFTTNTTGNVHAGLGFSGHGLAATKLGGKTLASLVLHVDDEWSSLPVVGPPLSQLPPEPLRWPLLQAVVWAVDSGDWAQERGRRRGALRGLVASSVTLIATAGGGGRTGGRHARRNGASPRCWPRADEPYHSRRHHMRYRLQSGSRRGRPVDLGGRL